MFKKLCGEGFLKNVIIVTNMWSDVSPGVGEAREQELRKDKMLFKPVLDAGARMLRHDGTKASAQDILQQFLFNPPLPLRIQQELIIEKKAITETAACEELDRELEGLKKRQEEELRDLRQQFEEAKRDRDNQAMEELDLSRREVEEKLRSLTDRREKLSEEYIDIRSQPRDEISELQGAIAAAKRSEADLRKLFKEAEEGYLREIRHLHEEVQQVKSDSKRRLKDLVVKHIAELNSQADRLAPWRIGSRTRERNEGLEWEQTVREIREMENSKRKAEMSEGYQDSRKKHHPAIEEAPLPGCIALGGYLARQDGKKYEKQEESGCRKEMKRKHLGKRRLHSTSHLSPIAEIGADWVLTEDSAR